MPRNSARSRRARWSGSVQSAYPRCPPTEAMRAALPIGSAGSCAGDECSWSTVMSRLGGRCQVGGPAFGQGEGVDDPIEELLAHPLGEGGLLEGEVVVDGVVRDDRGLVVADDGRQGGDHH